MKISLAAVSQFAFSVGTCLSSGMPPRKALELSGSGLRSAALNRAVRAAAHACDEGVAISDGLRSWGRWFPHFVIPVIQAGELSGRHVESYQLIHEHCERLRPTLRLLRNVWLYPLICILFGWVVRLGLLMYFGLSQAAWLFFRDTVLSSLALVIIVWVSLQISAVRQGVDLLLLQLPLIRETIVRLSMTLFFATFRLGYEAGGLGVLKVFDIALTTVGNRAVRKDLLRARPILEERGSFEDAFSEPRLIDDHIRSSIAAGALSGHLGASLDQVVKRERLDLESALDRFNRALLFVVGYGVAMSIAGTLLFCLLSAPDR